MTHGAQAQGASNLLEKVLADRARFQVVRGARQQTPDPSPLKVKDVWIEGRRYLVSLNDEEVENNCAQREAIRAGLREQLRHNDKSLIGNQGHRR